MKSHKKHQSPAVVKVIKIKSSSTFFSVHSSFQHFHDMLLQRTPQQEWTRNVGTIRAGVGVISAVFCRSCGDIDLLQVRG